MIHTNTNPVRKIKEFHDLPESVKTGRVNIQGKYLILANLYRTSREVCVYIYRDINEMIPTRYKGRK